MRGLPKPPPKAKEIYTLQRCYHEAKALLEKYQYSVHEYKLGISFRIEQSNEVLPKLWIAITYDHDRYNSDQRIFASASSPVLALSDFEDELRKKTGKTLIDSVGVELEKM